MNNKLSSTDRQRVSSALTECAQKTKDINDPAELSDAAYSILSSKLGDNPGLFKAACQVYNSCKSIHKLSEATDDTRGNSFSILNVHDMVDRLTDDSKKRIQKAASAPAKFSVNKATADRQPIQKVASAERGDVNFKKRPMPEITDYDFKKFIREELEDIESFVRKHASELRNCQIARDEAMDMFVAAFATEPGSFRKEAAARLYANYGDVAVDLLDEFSVTRPMNKVASETYKHKYTGTPSLPNTPIYTLAKEAMDTKTKYSREAADHETIVEEMTKSVLDYAKQYMGVRKQAAAVASAAVGASAMTGLSKLLGLDDDSEADLRNEIYTTAMINNMLSHSYQRSFMRAATQKAISKYALVKIVDAFNRAVAKLPPNTRMVPATANQQLIESIMIDELAKGSVPSKADTEIISNLANTLGKLETDKGIYVGNVTHDKQGS